MNTFKTSKLSQALLLTLCLILCFSLSACGGSSSSSGGGEAKAEKYVVATEPTYPPFETTEEDGTLVGFDIDLMEAIAEDQGFEVEWASLAFDALIPSLGAGNSDIVIAGISSTPERAKNADFSDGYFFGGSAVMVMADSELNSMDDVNADTTFATQIGTVMADVLLKMQEDGECGDVTQLDVFSTCVMQMQNGDVMAVAADAITIDAYMAEKDGFKKIGNLPSLNDDPYNRIAVKKGNAELLDKINAGLAHLIENGKYAEICKKYELAADNYEKK